MNMGDCEPCWAEEEDEDDSCDETALLSWFRFMEKNGDALCSD